MMKNIDRLKDKMDFLCPFGIDSFEVRGGFGLENFDYVKIGVYGCELQDECLADQQISKQSLNLISLRAQPTLIDEEGASTKGNAVIDYPTDLSYFKMLDPANTQASNFYYTQSEIHIKENIFDVFDLFERRFDFFQEMGRFDNYEVITPGTPVEDREYLAIFFRAATEKNIYKSVKYEFFGYLGDLGGFLRVLSTFGKAVTFIIGAKRFRSAIISKVYRVQKYDRDFTQFYRTKIPHTTSYVFDEPGSGIPPPEQQ